MNNKSLRWEILNKVKSQKSKVKSEDIVDILLENRGISTKKEKEEFFNPTPPEKITVKSLSISEKEISKAIKRIKKAIKDKEEIIIYGDYDADGICATAILWECLYSLTKNIHPYIPDRFGEGYGLNSESVQKLKISTFAKASADKKNLNLGLIITVDNGIVANKAIDAANGLGIDVIITDHHQKGKKNPKAHSIVHTDKISGSGIAWLLAREIRKRIKNQELRSKDNALELAAIGTIADQLPLIGANRSFAKYGLEVLNSTKRPGLLALYEEAALKQDSVGTYEVNYVIAPRINAMGRMEHAIDSLRLLCTTSTQRARELAQYLGRTNRERQKVVDEVVLHARELALRRSWSGAIVLAHESYHEGVIGLAASKLVEEFYRPAIVLSKGEKYSKASARSVSGFNIIENIRKLDTLIMGGGGHPMAAGFNIETDKIEAFSKKFEEITSPLLTQEILSRKLKIDMILEFSDINQELVDKLAVFEPTGIGNPAPMFATCDAKVIDARTVGADGKHLKLTLEKNDKIFAAIAFGKGDVFPHLLPYKSVNIAYNIEENVWNGNKSLQLKVKDIKIR